MDPHRYKEIGIILAEVRKLVEPSLLATGFRFEDRNKTGETYRFLDYVRPGEELRIAFDRRNDKRLLGLAAEWIRQSDSAVWTAEESLDVSNQWLNSEQFTAETNSRITSFATKVNSFVNRLV